VYIAPTSSNGTGAVWTKLAESGYSHGKWAVEVLIANRGKHSVVLPSSLAPGDYLLRAEIIALHEADTDYLTNKGRGAQFYPSCSQITVKSGGKATPPEHFNFVGGYTPTNPGILFDLYNSYTSYKVPGPAVWTGAGTGSPATTYKPSSSKIHAKPGTVATISGPVTTITTTYHPKMPTRMPTTMTTKTRKHSSSRRPYPGPSYGEAASKAIKSYHSYPGPSYGEAASKATKSYYSSYPGPSYGEVAAHATKSWRHAHRHSKKVPKATKKPFRPSPTSPSYGAAAPKASKSPEEVNKCLDAVNACIAQSQSSIGGVVDFSACEKKRANCY